MNVKQAIGRLHEAWTRLIRPRHGHDGQAALVASDRQQRGRAAEDAAAHFLQARGLHLMARNFRVRGGEIDLICRDGAQTVFVEVRARRAGKYGCAAESISPTKRRRIVLAARHWLQRHGQTPCRFDCLLFDGDQLTWLRDAFPAD